MAISIATIRAPVDEEMKLFKQRFIDLATSDIQLINYILNYIFLREGKQLRPMCVFLVAGACGLINDATHRGAALIELFHTTSLVHDDVVDDSNYRRGSYSVNALWGNKTATRMGDYLSSLAMQLALNHGDFQILKLFSTAVSEITQGELLQIEQVRWLKITEPVYLEVIRKKTASLMAACCAIGAQSAQAKPATIQQAHLFGEKTGMAFQIKDDLFDYGQADIGKPLGADIKEKKLTLPLIYTLRKADWFTKRRILNLIKTQSDNPEKVAEVIRLVEASGGLDYAINKMHQYADEAKALLAIFPDSIYTTSLRQLVDYCVVRDH